MSEIHPPERFVVEYQQLHARVASLATDRRGVPRWYAMHGPCVSVEAAEGAIERAGQHPHPGTYRRYRIVRQVGFARRPDTSSNPGSWWFRTVDVVSEQPWPVDLPEDAIA